MLMVGAWPAVSPTMLTVSMSPPAPPCPPGYASTPDGDDGRARLPV